MGHSISRREFVQLSAAECGALLLQKSFDIGARPELHVCPKSRRPANVMSTMRVMDLTTDAWDLRLTLSCLQGIVNRSQPRLYLIHDDYDEMWLDWMKERGDIEQIRRMEASDVFKAFLPEVQEAYVIDPAVPATINVATMLAAVRGGLVTTPRMLYEFDLPAGYPLDSWKRGIDFRYMRWKKDLDAYRWFFQHYEQELSRQAVAIVDPHEVAIRDYLVEFKIPVLWVAGEQDARIHPTASPEEEEQFVCDILMKWPPNIPCLGWPSSGDDDATHGGLGEPLGIRLISQCGKFEQCSAYDGYSPTVGNLSVHSGTSAEFRQTTPPIHLDKSKVYYSFVRSDGDGWNFQRHYYRKLFDDAAHGKVPLGWQIGPTAFDAIPDILDYYYKHARPGDCFVNALTGLGYILEDVYAANYPLTEQEQILKDYVKLSSLYRARIDASVMSTHTEMGQNKLADFARVEGIRGIFANYGRRRGTTEDNLITLAGGIPIFRAVNDGPSKGLPLTEYSRKDVVWFEVNNIKRYTPARRPMFLHVFLGNWIVDMQMVEEIAQGLAPDFTPVRPDQLVSLYEQSMKAG